MKKYFAKVYSYVDDSYITTWIDVTPISFKKQINGGLGELTLNKASKFDDFDEGGSVALNNRVEFWLSDIDTPPEGIRIYNGYISGYNPWINGSKQGVEIHCLGYVSKLTKAIVRNGNTVGFNFDNDDPASMVRKVIDYYRNSVPGATINYTSSSVRNTGTKRYYSLKTITVKEALDKILQLAPADWWWYVDADNVLWFQPKPTDATHTFIFRKDFKKVEVFKNMENIKNWLLFYNGKQDNDPDKLFISYSDATSILRYGTQTEIKTDSRITNRETANNWASTYLNAWKNPEIKTVVEILDNNNGNGGYDIESINPGDTCRFRGFNEITSQTFEDNMLITGVEYSLDLARLEIESLQTSLAREAERTARNLDEQITSDSPATFE